MLSSSESSYSKETDLRFLHVIISGEIKAQTISCISTTTKGHTVTSEACHFDLLSAVILVDFSNDSLVFRITHRWQSIAGGKEKQEILCNYSQMLRCGQACLVAGCISRPSSNKFISHRYIIRLSVKKMRCKCLLKGDGLSKQIILLFLVHVHCVIGRLLHTTQNIHTDVPQCTNNMTKCALCERKTKSWSQRPILIWDCRAHTLYKNTERVCPGLGFCAGVVQTL